MIEEVKKKWGEFKVTSSRELRVNCHRCDDVRYRLYLNLEKGMACCFNCGYRTRKLFSLMRLKPPAKKQNLVQQVDRHGEDMPFLTPLTSSAPPLIWEYARSRMTEEQIRKYNVSFCPTQGKYQSRLILPVTKNYETVYFQARTVIKGHDPKYLNPHSKEVILGKSKVVWNLDRVKRKSSVCVICEGILSAMTVPNDMGVSILGKDISDEQARLLTEKKFSTYVIMFDPQTEGERIKAAKKLLQFKALDVRVASLEGGDPYDLGPVEVGRKVFSARSHTLESVFLEQVKRNLSR